jgi:hypothetical protein
VKAAYPQAKTYTTRAVDRALASGGFLERNAAAARSRRDPNESAARREETEIFLATMDASAALRADVPVERSGAMTIAGRPLDVRVAANAVTDADLWLYDAATGVAVIGDLVTLPAPFFETACPARWQAALDEVWATPFRVGRTRPRPDDVAHRVRHLSPRLRATSARVSALRTPRVHAPPAGRRI